MHTYMEAGRRSSPFWCVAAMRDELMRALTEALFELDVLPCEEDAAVLGLYAVMDDLDRAIRRTQSLDGDPI
jgi:hypothetical protein